MFDIGWAEMAVIVVVALIIVGPKDLPNVLRTGARWMRQLRKLSREFQSGVDSLVREAELDEAKKIVTSAKQGTLKRQLETAVDPTGEMAKSLDPKRMMREVESDDKKPGAAAATPKSAGAKPDAKSGAAAPAVESKTDTLQGAPKPVVSAPSESASATAPAAPAQAEEPVETGGAARKTGS